MIKMTDNIPCPVCKSTKIRHLWPMDRKMPVFGVECRKCGHLKYWLYKEKKRCTE